MQLFRDVNNVLCDKVRVAFRFRFPRVFCRPQKAAYVFFLSEMKIACLTKRFLRLTTVRVLQFTYMKVICNRYNSFRPEKKGIHSRIVILIRQTLEEKELNETKIIVTLD